MTLMLMLSLISVLVISGLRAYVYGQARWGIGEHRAVEQLRRYAVDGDEATYQRYRDNLAVPLGDRLARLQLQRLHPDYALARRGLLAGGNAPADVTGLIVLFRLLNWQPLMAHAVAVWSSADSLIAGVQYNAERLHAQMAGGHPDPQAIRASLAQIDDLHRRVVPLEQQFGATLGTASRQIGALILILLPLSCALLLLAGVSLSRSQLRRDARLADTLRELATSLRRQATHDSLTDLTNRAEFELLLKAAIAAGVRGETHWWLLYFDLDQFKVINDTCGHAAERIKKVAWLVRSQLHPDDVLARLGGDEFGVLLPRRTHARSRIAAGGGYPATDQWPALSVHGSVVRGQRKSWHAGAG
jgi:GGDEF domain-containing protein